MIVSMEKILLQKHPNTDEPWLSDFNAPLLIAVCKM